MARGALSEIGHSRRNDLLRRSQEKYTFGVLGSKLTTAS